MALRALMLRKKIDEKKKQLEQVKAKASDLEKREEELAQAIDEAETDEERNTVEDEVEKHEAAKKENSEEAEQLESDIADLEGELEKEEQEQDTTPEGETRTEEKEMPTNVIMETRDRAADMIKREDVQAFLGEVRDHIREKRALNNVGLTIPEVMLGMLRENIVNYSKLYKHVTVRSVSGTARELIMGALPEAIWTECCANLNELNLTFYDSEVDCYKVGGYFAICNATLEDSDLNLASEIMTALGQSIGYALDKAILYGRNTTANQKMPLGIVTRLAQTAQPATYSQTARPWVDLHTTNILSVASGVTGAALIQALALDFANAKGKYSRGPKLWVMNESTYTKLAASTITQAADGSIVTGIFNQMPVIGGTIEVLDFIPDDVIIAGYFDLYLLAERAGNQFATSEHVRFLQDQTVMKGTARYDGAPRIAEAFVAIGINGVTPDTTMTFAADTANTGA